MKSIVSVFTSLLVILPFSILTACDGLNAPGGTQGPANTIPVTEFYSNGLNWNDYVKNDGVDRYSASDIPCDGSETGGYDACIHGGELRVFDIGSNDACTGLSAADALSAFDWVCDDSGATTVFYSSGLADGKKLSDLIDFTSTPIDWKNNQLVVTGGAGYTSASAPWWSNPIVVDNDGMIAGDAVAGTIYVVTADPQNSYIIDQSSVGLVIKPGVTMTGSAVPGSPISVKNQNFFWLEGVHDSTGNYGIYLDNVKFSVLRSVTSDNGTAGVFLNSSSSNTLSRVSTNGSGISLVFGSHDNILQWVTVANSSSYGITISLSSNNTLSGVSANNNGWTGVLLSDSVNNKLTDVSVNGNGFYGVALESSANNNTLLGVKATNNNKDGIFLIGSNGNTLSDVSAINNGANGIYANGFSSNKLSKVNVANNSTYGIYFGSSSDNILSGVTATSSINDGVYIAASANNILSRVTTTNNFTTGIVITSSNNTLTGVVAANNKNGVALLGASSNTLSGLTAANNSSGGIGLLFSSTDNTFSGPLKVGNNAAGDCYVDAESTSIGGLMDDVGGVDATHDGVCIQAAPSDFGSATTSVSVASSFVGKVIVDDIANTSDASGTAAYPADPMLFDWTNFDNLFRSWGKDGSAFPNADHGIRWFTGTGRIWDWSLKSTDTVLRNALALPTGNDILTHTWSDATTTTFLRNAVELSDDGVGNDNLLCESNEECLYTPNMGSYQGHGALISAGAFADGTITGVTLWKYSSNGY